MELKGNKTMLTDTLLVIAIVASQKTSIDYQKIDSMQECQAIVMDITEYNEEGVHAICVPLEPIIEA